MAIFAVQYLESPYPDATPAAVRRRLHQACDHLPISLILLGWDLPPAIEEAVAEEAAHQNAKLFRWQPLLTGDAHIDLPSEWATIGLGGIPIPGHAGMPEFTFICPNRSAVADFLSERVESVATGGLFQGIFLDRIRFPSPSINPLRDLTCFCRHCTRLAADTGLDLESAGRYIQNLSAKDIARSLLGQPAEPGSILESFLDFRSTCITRTVQMAAEQARSHNLSVGLDCFSPSLTRMVGQNIPTLNGTADWVKIMSYPRVFGPAGIPFELMGLLNWLLQTGMAETEALQLLAQCSGLPIPASKAELGCTGIASEAIKREIQRGYEMNITKLLAGIALVEMKNIHESTPAQIQADLQASRAADGLVLSWDLWLTPIAHLDTIQTLWN